jgi:hypothetical protein
MYIRFVTRKVHQNSLRRTGIFQEAFRLRNAGHLPEYEEAILCELLEWFNSNLPKPHRFTNSKPPYYRKKNEAISWFKHTATEHIAKARHILTILENHGIHAEMITTDRPGYIVYEDAVQIVAVPFSDSRAGLAGPPGLGRSWR